MAIERSRYVTADPFSAWQNDMKADAEAAGVPWGVYLQTLSADQVPECARSFVAAYRRPSNRNPRKDPNR
jgi:hypothetical protein